MLINGKAGRRGNALALQVKPGARSRTCASRGNTMAGKQKRLRKKIDVNKKGPLAAIRKRRKEMQKQLDEAFGKGRGDK